ncbi:FtsX-like permease family protein [Microbacterium sp. KR10-403]|uniref:FtsX-like permease family protein n=1 Tax=Microbacterium sp. KR10-403 TaxID=3158581 RepID=UPI0032E52A55
MTGRRGLSLALRSAATSPAVSLIVVVLTAVIAFVGAAVPALLDDARTATVQKQLSALPRAALDPTATLKGAASPDSTVGGDPWSLADDTVAGIHRDLPLPLRTVLGDPGVVVVLDGQASVPTPHVPAPSNRVEVALDPGLEGRIRIVRGRMPRTTEIATAAHPVVEVVLSREASQALDWPLDQKRVLDFTDLPMTVRLVGLYDAVDPEDPAWVQRPTGLHPSADQGGGEPVHLATAYASADMLGAIDVWAGASSTTVWMPLLDHRVTGAQAAELAAQLRGFSASPQAFSVRGPGMFEQGLTFRSSAPQVLQAGAARGDAMAAVATLAAVGPLGVAVVAVAMAGRMLASRRVGTVRAARARGASLRLLTVLLGAEGLVLGALGAAAGAVLAAIVIGWAGAASALVPVIVALTPVIAVPSAALNAAARTARRDLGVADRPTRRRRLIVEAAIVAIAVAVIAVSLNRPVGMGLTPVLLAVPLAVFAIACVVVLRLMPPTLTGVEALVARGRGVMALVGPARARRGRTLPIATVLAALVCVATALFAGVAIATIGSGITQSARAQTGADLRVSGSALDDDQVSAMRQVTGVDAAAAVTGGASLPAHAKGRWVTVTVFGVDPGELAAVQRGVVGALPLPAELGAGAGAGSGAGSASGAGGSGAGAGSGAGGSGAGAGSGADGGAGDGPVPAVVSDALADMLDGGTLTVHGVEVQAAAHTARVAFAPEGRWLVVSRDDLTRLLGPAPGIDTVLIDVADGADVQQVAASLRSLLGDDAQVIDPADIAAQTTADPAMQAVRVSLVAALAVVTLLLVLAVTMTLLRGAPVRGRMLGLLGAMGYPRGRELPLVAWEVAPPLLLALPIGVAAGFALPPLLLPAVDLARFVGGSATVPITAPPWLAWLTVGGYLLIAVIAVTVAAAVAARMTAMIALRRIDEEIET